MPVAGGAGFTTGALLTALTVTGVPTTGSGGAAGMGVAAAAAVPPPLLPAMRQSPQIGLFPWYELVKLLAQTAQLWTRRRGMILIDSTRPLLPYVNAGPPSFLRGGFRLLGAMSVGRVCVRGVAKQTTFSL